MKIGNSELIRNIDNYCINDLGIPSIVLMENAAIKVVKNIDFEKFKSEITGVEDAYKELIGKDMPKYFRPPMGKFSEQSLKYTQDLGYSSIFWSFAYVDWYNDKQPTHEYAKDKIYTRTHPGAIVLLHPNSKTNTEILDEVITHWKEEGYSLKTLDYLTKNKDKN